MSSHADVTKEILQFRSAVVVPVVRGGKWNSLCVQGRKAVMCRELMRGATLCKSPLLYRNDLHPVKW